MTDRGDREHINSTIANLAKRRHEDNAEMYHEERFGFQASKRALQQDDDEDDLRFDEPRTKKLLTAAERMMASMGYKEGEGLGKNKQGIQEPVALSTQRGRTGLGNQAGKAFARDFNEVWDETAEKKTVEEKVRWLANLEEGKRQEICDKLNDDKWMVVGKEKKMIDDEINFCGQSVLAEMIEAKNVFNLMSAKDLREARTRFDPYETIGSAFFQNRDAMKTANMDKIYDWILSRENTENDKFLLKNPVKEGQAAENIDRDEELFYFADVCAGPGGFSEYMLWRKGYYNAKGFGFTLSGEDDFKLQEFSASSAFFFETFYGTKQNGDVTDPENIDSLEDFISRETDGKGVHLMMADGGFSVEGQENIQEILSKRLYLCQFLVSLCIVREGGNFFCKLFDIFTPFSIALIYLMRVCYDSVSLHKPHTSRPENSEQYITCKGLRREYAEVVKNYLKRVNRKMDKFKNERSEDDVMELMPLDVIKSDTKFMDEIIEHNEHLANRQTMYLRKYKSFAKNQGQVDRDPGYIREECLRYWHVPNRQRPRATNMQRLSPHAIFGKYAPKICSDTDFGNQFPEFQIKLLQSPIPSNIPYEEYRFVSLGSTSNPQLLISTGDSVFFFRNGHFEQITNNYARIPENTILLIDWAKEVKRDGNKIQISRDPEVMRIIDAAVLYGDNIADLPYETRMKTAQKFVKALKLTKRTVQQGWGNRAQQITPHLITCAQTYSLNELDAFRSNLEETKPDRELTILNKEGNFTFFNKGLRFTRIIKQEWQMGWSKSKQVPYVHSPYHQKMGSIVVELWAEKSIYSSFWDCVILTKRDRMKMDEMARNNNFAIQSSIWSWKACYRTPYGPEKILNHPEEFEGKATLASVKYQIEKTDASVHRVRDQCVLDTSLFRELFREISLSGLETAHC